LKNDGDALVVVGGLARHDPEARAADHGVLRRAGDVLVIGQGGDAEVELGVLLDRAEQARRRR
jgi:hypothetical protein